VKKAVTVSSAHGIPEVPPPPDMSSLYLNGTFVSSQQIFWMVQ
jgi:hypothetical protein